MRMDEIIKLADRIFDLLEDKYDKLVDKIIETAAEYGAKAGIAAYKQAHEAAVNEAHDRRLHNTELLLDNYLEFQTASEKAVYRAESCDTLENILDELMFPDRSDGVVIHSIMNSAARTAIILSHINRMLDVYKQDCLGSGKVEVERRWRIIEAMYLSEDRKTIRELEEPLHVSWRQLYDDRRKAFEQLSIYLFGIDALASLLEGWKW